MSPNAAGTALKNSILAGLAVVIVHFIFKNLSIDRDAHAAHRHMHARMPPASELEWVPRHRHPRAPPPAYESESESESESDSDSDSGRTCPKIVRKPAPDILQYVFAAEAAAPAAPPVNRRTTSPSVSVEAFDGGSFGTSLLGEDDANDAKNSLDALFAPLK